MNDEMKNQNVLDSIMSGEIPISSEAGKKFHEDFFSQSKDFEKKMKKDIKKAKILPLKKIKL